MKQLKLNSNWKMRDLTWKDYIPATVPGTVCSDLLGAGIIEDPYYRDNELATLKLANEEYEYVTIFDVDEDVLARERVLLHFDGIDTLADVFMNDRKIASVANMHRTYEFDVKEYITKSGNELKIIFHSPTKYIGEKYAEHTLDGTSDAMRGFPYIRKAHCMFGWDWGPRIPDAGLWRPVSLLAYDVARIDSVYVKQKHNVIDDCKDINGIANNVKSVTLSFQTSLEHASGYVTAYPFVEEDLVSRAYPKLQNVSCKIEVYTPDGERIISQEGTEDIEIDHPELWWPNGLGSQPLYTVKVMLCNHDTVIDIWERRIGLRTMTMTIRKDEYGESFAHTVNGVEVFAMGADYIPEDNLLSRTNPERTRQLLEDAVAANHNCIRVWGGGYYPEDWFYDTCDELGLMVWQDFMFACAVYDLSEEFEANIVAEFKDNIKRLRHHASLGLWCGNNEMEMFIKRGEWVNSPKEQSDYVKMYEYMIPKVLKEYDPETFYWPASPSSGGAFDEPNDENRGDVHYWDVWHGDKPITEYRKFHFRYLSEFGFQSFPAMKTIESFTLPEDRNVYSYVMEKHQRNNTANGKIANYMSQTYLYPTAFSTFVYASQLLQAQAIRYGVEHFRRWRGRCMGTVVWQLNDCWPVASWSSIDYYGRWKALHYYEKRFFAPVLLSCEEEGILTQNTNPNAEPYEVKKSVRFNVSNETMQAHNVKVCWKLCDAHGNVKRQEEEDMTVAIMSAKWLDKVELPDADLYRDHVFYELYEDGDRISAASVLFCQPKYYRFEDPKLGYRIEGDEIVVSAQAYAKDVEIQSEAGDLLLADNYFDMEPGERRIKVIRGAVEKLTLRSNYDIH